MVKLGAEIRVNSVQIHNISKNKEALYLITLIGIDNANVGKRKVPASPRFFYCALPLTRTGAIGDADAVADLN